MLKPRVPRRRVPKRHAVQRRAIAPLFALCVLLAASCASDSDTSAPVVTTPVVTTPTAISEPAGGASSTAASSGTSGIDFAEVEAALTEFVDDNGLSGAGFAVVDAEDGLVFEGYAGDFTPERASLVASMSKQVTAGVLMRLDDEGVLDIDAPISEVVGDAWGAGDDSLADRTIAQMLSHSAGMVGLSELRYAPYFCQFDADQEIEQCGAEMYSTPTDDGDVFEPDTRWEYGGGQWQLAGAIAEYASGESWSELVERIYVEPCDLSVGFGYTNHWASLAGGSTDYPSAYSGDPSQLEATENPNIEGGVYTTVPDYAALLLMYLRSGACPNGQVLSQTAIDEMHVDRIGAVYSGDARSGDNGYGIGWWVDRTTGRVFNDGAYGSQAWLDLEGGYGAYLVVEDGPGKRFKTEIEPLLDELLAG